MKVSLLILFHLLGGGQVYVTKDTVIVTTIFIKVNINDTEVFKTEWHCTGSQTIQHQEHLLFFFYVEEFRLPKYILNNYEFVFLYGINPYIKSNQSEQLVIC